MGSSFIILLSSATVCLAATEPVSSSHDTDSIETQPNAHSESSFRTEEVPVDATRGKMLWHEKLTLKGFAVTWLRFAEAPENGEDPQGAFRLPFVRLILDAKPVEHWKYKMVVAFDNSNLLFNNQATFHKYRHLNVTVGQMKLPFSASIRTPAHKFFVLFRPRYIVRLTKVRFRDIGLKIHNEVASLGGFLSYEFGVFNGSGVQAVGPGGPIAPSPRYFLYTGRLSTQLGDHLFDEGDLEIAVHYAYNAQEASTDAQSAQNFIGRNTVAFFDRERVTQLMGGDFTLNKNQFYLRGEALYLFAVAGGENRESQSAFGFNVDLGYAVEPIGLQPAIRFEMFDPNTSEGSRLDEIYEWTIGFNYRPNKNVVLSLFGGLILDELGTNGTDAPNHHIDSRVMLKF